MPVPVAYETPPNRAYVLWMFHVNLVSITGNNDVITTFTPGFVGSILRTCWVTGTPATTINKAATLNWEINAVNLVGGTIALTTATVTPLGAVIEGAAITGSNSFNRTDTVSLEASGVTAFSEGDGMVVALVEIPIF